MLGSAFLKFLTLATISTMAMAHSRMSSPATRDPEALIFGDAPGNCENTNKSPKATYTRGQEIPIQWARNNHPGGFIRVSVVPMADSDTAGIFDQTDNIEQLHCHESGCGSSDPLNSPGMLFGDPPGKNQPYQNTCEKTFTIPNHLADGSYTLQWLWYGPGSHYANLNQSEGEYKSCHDFTVKGGTTFAAKAAGSCPVYKGGDVHQNSDKCLFMAVTEPGQLKQDDALTASAGHVVWALNGQTSFSFNFGYPYPNLFKTCKKSGQPSTKRSLKGSDFSTTNVTHSYSHDIPDVKGLEKYYRQSA